MLDMRSMELAVAASEARQDAKTATLGGRIDTLSATFAALKDRFDDLAAKLGNVPADMATVKERIAHLPTKDELGTKLRNWMLAGSALTSVLIAAIGLAIRFAPHS